MKFVNINDIEEFVISKFIIESYKLKNNEIQSKQHLSDFMNDISKSMYSLSLDNSTKIINFSVMKIPDETFVFVVNDDETEHNTIDEYMSKIGYDFTKLTKFNMNEAFQSGNVPKTFLIKGRNYYKF